MHLFKRVDELQVFLNTERVNNRSVGFVPTMGALHDGHLSLVRQSLAENQITVASIFVNPTQFNELSDLARYPRTPGKDLQLLAKVGCDLVFLPEPADIYPPGLDTILDLNLSGLDTRLEGLQRPGHFDGVAQVVKRFLDIIRPENLYMGQKDYQQQLIVKEMIRVLDLPYRVVTMPTAREEDGLAMSSRNMLLDPELRPRVNLLYKTLMEAKQRLVKGSTPAEIEKWAMEELSQPGFRPEYFTIVDGHSLQPLTEKEEYAEFVVACTAVWAGEVRLIDNFLLRGKM
jgi:pantoate--beta-alanine ligase